MPDCRNAPHGRQAGNARVSAPKRGEVQGQVHGQVQGQVQATSDIANAEPAGTANAELAGTANAEPADEQKRLVKKLFIPKSFVRIRTFCKSSYRDGTFKISYSTARPFLKWHSREKMEEIANNNNKVAPATESGTRVA